MSIRASTTLATVYQELAESLSEPLDRFAHAGKNWSLYEAAMELSQEIVHPPLQKAIVELASILSESWQRRDRRYRSLLAYDVPIYESLVVDGRLHSATTLRVWTLYRSVGLHINGRELPDHVSIELAFLAYLVQQEVNTTKEHRLWRKARREFIKQHAAKWMPSLGKSLARTSDPVYRPIGLLLSAIIQVEILPPRKQSATRECRLPKFVNDTTCTLCGFCTQVCPTQSITIYENHNATMLQMLDTKCLSCDKCVHICPTNILQLEALQPEK